MTKDIVVSGLIEKRRELAGVIDQLKRQLDQHRADLVHIDGALRVLATDLDPETLRPKRAYRRNRYFAAQLGRKGGALGIDRQDQIVVAVGDQLSRSLRAKAGTCAGGERNSGQAAQGHPLGVALALDLDDDHVDAVRWRHSAQDRVNLQHLGFWPLR